MLKNKILTFVFIGIIVVGMSGCNKNFIDNNTPNTSSVSSEKTNKKDDIKIEKEPDEETNEEAIELVPKTNVTKEGKYTIKYVKSNIAKVVNPPKKTSIYTYYKAEKEGHKYLYVVIDYKNLEEDAVDADEVGSLSVKFADKYDYDGFSVIVDTDGDFTYSNITDIEPLTVGQLYYLVDLPKEVVDSEESLVATYTVGTDTYTINIR